jgi:hypothetical protein
MILSLFIYLRNAHVRKVHLSVYFRDNSLGNTFGVTQ